MRPALYLADSPSVPAPQRTARMNILLTAGLAAFMYLGIVGVIGASLLSGNPPPARPAVVTVAGR